ncbi:unnamed protein product [Dibothriocephalus latus]|uniref:Galactosyltransferase C-terminal domain-containing protein n=1 Tax=Dibothriocephalus latus TaxID=60516 RepID=A0A3P7MKA2_DIBLA|nr:unnamed protein product [Dibothriocephalus latus]
MEYVPFDELALKWGLYSDQVIWTGRSTFTDVAYTLENITRDDNQPARIYWTPVGCYQEELTAIIIPYRNRFANLSVFLNHMHPFLRHQRRRYTIFVIEQVTPTIFNRAALLNIGFREAVRAGNYSCFIFHDVDRLPEDARMIYGCEDQPLHMAVLTDEFNYTMHYEGFLGGALAMTRMQFEKARGFANTYFGWGGEDDEMYNRLKFSNQPFMRRNYTLSRYKRLTRSRQYWQKDTYQDIQYRIQQSGLRYNGLYYHFNVSILHPTVEYSRAIGSS